MQCESHTPRSLKKKCGHQMGVNRLACILTDVCNIRSLTAAQKRSALKLGYILHYQAIK